MEVYPGFSAAEVLYDENGGVRGVATRDVGLNKDGSKGENYEPGWSSWPNRHCWRRAPRGSCSEEVMQIFDLKDCDPQQFGSGRSEGGPVGRGAFRGEVPSSPGLVQHDARCQPGFVQHTITSHVRWFIPVPHGSQSSRGIGCRVGLQRIPISRPTRNFSGSSTIPSLSKHLEGGDCVAYAARVINGYWL